MSQQVEGSHDFIFENIGFDDMNFSIENTSLTFGHHQDCLFGVREDTLSSLTSQNVNTSQYNDIMNAPATFRGNTFEATVDNVIHANDVQGHNFYANSVGTAFDIHAAETFNVSVTFDTSAQQVPSTQNTEIVEISNFTDKRQVTIEKGSFSVEKHTEEHQLTLQTLTERIQQIESWKAKYENKVNKVETVVEKIYNQEQRYISTLENDRQAVQNLSEAVKRVEVENKELRQDLTTHFNPRSQQRSTNMELRRTTTIDRVIPKPVARKSGKTPRKYTRFSPSELNVIMDFVRRFEKGENIRAMARNIFAHGLKTKTIHQIYVKVYNLIKRL